MNILCRSLAILVILALKLLVASEDLKRCIPELVMGECKEYYEYTTSLEDSVLQSNADPIIHLYDELLNIPCSNYFKLFLCIKYKPPCLKTKSNNFIFGNLCKSMCEHVYDMCYPYVKLRNNEWPPDLNCTQFPAKEITNECIYEKGYPKDTRFKFNEKSESRYGFNNASYSKYICFYLDDSNSKINYKCVPRCAAAVSKQFSILFLIISSSICLFLWLFSTIIFFKRKNNLFHSELCLIFISFSFIIYSLTYSISLKLNDQLVSCQNIFVNNEESGNVQLIKLQNTQNSFKVSINLVNDNIYSIIIFIILNYTRVAMIIWWLILSFYLFSNNLEIHQTNSKYINIF